MVKKEGAQKEKVQEKKKTCFIIMPITTPKTMWETYSGGEDHFKRVLEELFTPAIEKADMKPIPPKIKGSQEIHAEIIDYLEKADLVLCDMSALNPNVFFELGIRTAINKPVSLVVDDTSKKTVPFDLSTIQYQEYRSELRSWTQKEDEKLIAQHLKDTEEQSGEINSLWKYFGLTSTAQPAEKGSIEDKFDYIAREIATLKKVDAIDGGSFLSAEGKHVRGMFEKHGILLKRISENIEGKIFVYLIELSKFKTSPSLLKRLRQFARFAEVNIEIIFDGGSIISF